jgi:hypothetical protein
MSAEPTRCPKCNGAMVQDEEVSEVTQAGPSSHEGLDHRTGHGAV